MASIKIQSSSPGGGSITLTAPTTSSNRTVTLPDADVTLGGGTTHLGTLVPQSGAISATLSSLTLTDYKMLDINIEGVSLGSFQWIGITNKEERNAIAYTTDMTGKTLSVRVVIDLATSAFYSIISGMVTTSNGAFSQSSNYAGGKTNYDMNVSNSSTSVGIFTRGAGYGFTATGGSIRIYGVK